MKSIQTDRLIALFKYKLENEMWELPNELRLIRKGNRIMYIFASDIGEHAIHHVAFDRFISASRNIIDENDIQIGIIYDWSGGERSYDYVRVCISLVRLNREEKWG